MKAGVGAADAGKWGREGKTEGCEGGSDGDMDGMVMTVAWVAKVTWMKRLG